MKYYLQLVIILMLSPLVHAAQLTNDDLSLAAEALVKSKSVVGIMVTAIQPSGITTIALGETALGNNLKPQGNSVFEIASITKAFTGLLLAQAISENRLNETDEAQKFLSDFEIPYSQLPITIAELATHHSGLPAGFDKEFHPADELNPWADFSKAQLQALLKRTKMPAKPGAEYPFVYSNIGAALIGYVLEAVYHMPYERIVKEKILNPLAMTDTGVTLSSDQKQRLVHGYFNDQGVMHPIPLWESPGIPAAGALRSTMNDLILFAASLLSEKSPVADSFRRAIRDMASGSNSVSDSRSGLFWVLMPNENFVWHNGATYGKASFLGINLKKKTAVIVLCNTHPPSQEETLLGLRLMKKVNQD